MKMEPANWARRCCLGIGAWVVGGIVVASQVWDIWNAFGFFLPKEHIHLLDLIFMGFCITLFAMPISVVIIALKYRAFGRNRFPLTSLLSALVFWSLNNEPNRLEWLRVHCLLAVDLFLQALGFLWFAVKYLHASHHLTIIVVSILSPLALILLCYSIAIITYLHKQSPPIVEAM
ncbi:unnamed protein product [Cuscuta epithymum]|uniref:Uncharacterized protein n=1 Tax=Cuscuta epithymum TaxID=186058 RepID=A0AAV0EFA9_9ASTE|nr:unnamed protein product [Cuscuta epithymum]CAH9120750.1 unnamed protein product [Cuscuta epithymum]